MITKSSAAEPGCAQAGGSACAGARRGAVTNGVPALHGFGRQ